MYPDNKMKAVTFSYDDGIKQDIRLIELFNKYNLKCTFNLNTGIDIEKSNWLNNGLYIERMANEGLTELYKGHEIAAHSLTHALLTELSTNDVIKEMNDNIYNIEQLFGNKVLGMAYPFGEYNDKVVEILKNTGIKYARTISSTGRFDIQQDLLRFSPTCHHNDKNLMNLAEEFMAMKPTTEKIFYIWGHSYEFDLDNNWDMMEEFCKLISNRNDIFYGTNSEILL